MSIDTQRLRYLAEKATPGPWEVEAYADGQLQIVGDIRDVGEDEQHCATVVEDMRRPFDSAYIAAANPAAMSVLLDEIDRLRSFASEFVRWVEAGIQPENGLYEQARAALSQGEQK